MGHSATASLSGQPSHRRTYGAAAASSKHWAPPTAPLPPRSCWSCYHLAVRSGGASAARASGAVQRSHAPGGSRAHTARASRRPPRALTRGRAARSESGAAPERLIGHSVAAVRRFAAMYAA
eukprot:CAMPEP_0119419468 /NCGR_PEP_ID=MMETSP1335-20130426/20952_1 /TAXON_ID=259385 /ORGANISM="Chrysoculter rhomboideus, Strain RCC1486" /LENGTH=121 /DNA_ID=CAMNT_0007444777 /DNA_START=22 /DNA_END=388 /DNA_ORIENTATION=-